MGEATPEWSRIKAEQPGAHSELEALARHLFESYHSNAESEELDPSQLSDAIALEVVEFEDVGPHFSDEDVRDEYVARYVASQASERWDEPEEVIDLMTAANRFGIRTGTSADFAPLVLRLLAESHDRDLPSFMAKLARDEAANRSRFWTLYRDFCKALPNLDVEPESLAESLGPIVEATADDLAGGEIYNAVRLLAATSASVAERLVTAFLDRSGSPAVSFAPSALVGLFEFDEDRAHRTALDWTRTDQEAVRRGGVSALGRFPYRSGDAPLLAATKARFREMRETPDADTDYTLIRAHSDLLDRVPALRDGLGELMGREDPAARHEAARTLMRWKDTEHWQKWWLTGLERIAETPAENAGTLGMVDHALSTVAESEPEVVVSFLERFARERSEEELAAIEVEQLFPMTWRFLRTGGRKHLQVLVTRWFASTDTHLHWFAHQFVQAHARSGDQESNDDLGLDPEELSKLSPATTTHLLKRVMGWVVGGRPLATLLASALEISPDDPDSDSVGEVVSEALAGFVLYNYPGEAGGVLRRKAEAHKGTRTGRVVQQALDASEEYYEALRDLPELHEIRPPDRRLHLIELAQGTMQSRIMDEARKRSVILDLVHRVPLKYGRGFFSRDEDGGFSSTTGLTSFSHEVEIPRMEVINPVGMAFHRLLLRQAGLPDHRGETSPGE